MRQVSPETRAELRDVQLYRMDTPEHACPWGVKAEGPEVSYTPVIAVFTSAALMALALSAGVRGFMGLAISLLAMLKLMDVPAFAASFLKYDLLSQRWRAWSRLYPGVELLLGFGHAHATSLWSGWPGGRCGGVVGRDGDAVGGQGGVH